MLLLTALLLAGGPAGALAGRVARADGAAPGGACRVSAVAAAPRARGLRPPETQRAAAATDQGGAFRIAPLAAGDYALEAECGSARARAAATVRTGALTRLPGPLVLEADGRTPPARVPTLPVAGRVGLPDRGVRAALAFTDPSGAVRVALTSDAGGRFHGFLPRLPGGRWMVDVDVPGPPLTLRRHFEDVRVAGNHAWVELALPPVVLRGTVVSEDAEPVADVAVTATALGTGASQTAVTDAGGVFEFADLPQGRQRLVAAAPAGVADAAEVDVVPGGQANVQITLRPSARLEGQLMASGAPLAGAEVRAWLPGAEGPDSVQASADGSFAARVPAEILEVGLTIGAPGYALKMTRAAVGGSDPLTIALDTTAGALLLDAPAGAVVVHEGVAEPLGFIARWAAMNGGRAGEDVLFVPQVEPGEYALCLDGRCAAGTLDAGGRLALSVAP